MCGVGIQDHGIMIESDFSMMKTLDAYNYISLAENEQSTQS